MNMQDDETLRMYVEESREHLADIENDLLTIEDAGAQIDEELVNKVFRAAHSIKGGAGFMGLNHIKELSHKIENILGMVRSREIVPNPEVVNILLLAFDKLRELMNNVDVSDEIDITEHTVALNGLTEAFLEPAEKKTVSRRVDIRLPDGRVVFNVSEFDIAQARKSGKFIYLVEYDLIHDVHRKGKTPLDVLGLMQESGIIMECKVDVSSVGTLDDDELSFRLPFVVLFATIIEPDIVSALFDVDEQFIHTYTDEGPQSQSSGAPPRIKAPSPGPSIEAKSTLAQPPPSAVPQAGPPPEPETPGFEMPEGVVHKPQPETRARPVKAERAPVVTQPDTSLRVNVALLDTLMILAGELVLSRNQLLQAVSGADLRSVAIGAQRINLVTSELQEAIMLTRMQPIGNIFNKFPRVVRDLAIDLGKEIALTIEGKEVELDKTLIEGLSDPLTHLVRNSIDHGIELPKVRETAGKNPMGHILLRAYHEAGQVNIEVVDDGKGLDGNKIAAAAVSKDLIAEEAVRTMSDREKVNLIFLPGFSTAEKVTDISGRGVGMDVVKTNLDRLGGLVDINSTTGSGTTIRIKLPLTLAILPSLLVSAAGERFAIPQVNVDELLRLPASQVKDRIEKVGDAEVVRLRETLLPLMNLADVLNLDRTYPDPETGEARRDRRQSIADRRSRKSPFFVGECPPAEAPPRENPNGCPPDSPMNREPADRRFRASSALNIVVVSAGAFKYGLVVETLHDSEEIVVKPLGRHLKQCRGYAGATIMGDGRVALILDVASLAQVAGLTSLAGTDRVAELAQDATKFKGEELQSFLLFRSAPEDQFAVPLDLVARVEQIQSSDIENVGGNRVIQYRGESLPVFALDEVARVKPIPDKEELLVIVFNIAGREVGLLANTPVDAVNLSPQIDTSTLKQSGILGSTIIGTLTTLVVDIYEFVETLRPSWFAERKAARSSERLVASKNTVLLAEDSDFFRNQVKKSLEDDGFKVLAAEDGLVAWRLLEQHAGTVSVVVTDIEMPNMDGYELTRKIKEDSRFSHLPVIAVTSLAGDENVSKGQQAGIDDYQIKLDKEKLLEGIHRFVS